MFEREQFSNKKMHFEKKLKGNFCLIRNKVNFEGMGKNNFCLEGMEFKEKLFKETSFDKAIDHAFLI
jgi:hypothetical protein